MTAATAQQANARPEEIRYDRMISKHFLR